jgi:transposase
MKTIPLVPPPLPAEVAALMEQHPSLRVFIEYQQSLIASLQAEVRSLREQVESLQHENRDLRRQLGLHSGNSSQAPSRDWHHSSRARRPKSGRKAGGQQGHAGQTLRFAAEADAVEIHRVTHCGDCGHILGGLPPEGESRRQVFDLPPLRLQVTEHRAEIRVCPRCRRRTTAAFPVGVERPTQYGPQVKGLLLYLQAYQLLPYQRLSELCRDLLGRAISPGCVAQTAQQAAQRLLPFEAQLRHELTQAPVLHCDETGLYQNAKRHWLHVFSTPKATYHFAHAQRGYQAMLAAGVLPHFRGQAVHDHWESYQRFTACQHRFCNAHHLRELAAAEELEGQAWAAAMGRLLRNIKKAVTVAGQRGLVALPKRAQQRYRRLYRQILRQALPAYPTPPRTPGTRGPCKQSKSKNLLDRLLLYEDGTLAFMTDFRVPFDNNLAERDLRMMKVQQKISGGFRSQSGTQAFCRLRSFISTTRKRGGDVLAELTKLFQPPLLVAE